jgi:hypothetical protein
MEDIMDGRLYLLVTISGLESVGARLAYHDEDPGVQNLNMGWTGLTAPDGVPDPKSVTRVACACSKVSGDLHMLFSTAHGLFYSMQDALGNFQLNWLQVPSFVLQIPIGGIAPSFSGPAVCALDPDDNLHVFAIEQNKNILFHTVRYSGKSSNGAPPAGLAGQWQSFWLSIPLPYGRKINKNSSIACAVGIDGSVHLLIIDSLNQLHHSAMDADGNWPWKDVPMAQVSGHALSAFTEVSCSSSIANTIDVCAIDDTGAIYYTTYFLDGGDFSEWRNIISEMRAFLQNCPFPDFSSSLISCSTDQDNVLHICAVTAGLTIVPGGHIMYTKRTSSLFDTPKYSCPVSLQQYAGQTDSIVKSIGIAHN